MAKLSSSRVYGSLIVDNNIFSAETITANSFSGNLSGNAATATNATNADKVDGLHIAYVASLPGTPDADTLYFIPE